MVSCAEDNGWCRRFLLFGSWNYFCFQGSCVVDERPTRGCTRICWGRVLFHGPLATLDNDICHPRWSNLELQVESHLFWLDSGLPFSCKLRQTRLGENDNARHHRVCFSLFFPNFAQKTKEVCHTLFGLCKRTQGEWLPKWLQLWLQLQWPMPVLVERVSRRQTSCLQSYLRNHSLQQMILSVF